MPSICFFVHPAEFSGEGSIRAEGREAFTEPIDSNSCFERVCLRFAGMSVLREGRRRDPYRILGFIKILRANVHVTQACQ